MKPLLLLLFCLATFLHAADFDEKSARYHTMLLKKPEATALLSRLLDSWLETSDQAALLDLLQQRASSGTAADWRVLAALHEFTGNDAAALTSLDSAVKLTPDDPAARLARAKILAKLLRLDPALADLQLAAKDPTLHLDATTLTGRLLAQAGRPDDALKAWDSLLAKHPDDLGLHEDLIDLLLQENLMDQALAASRKLTDLTKDPYQKAIRRLRTAEILTLANKTTDAAAEYASILSLSAQDSWLERETLALTQKLFATSQNPSAWGKFLTITLAEAPTRTNLHLALAQHHLAAGDIEKALKIHQQLLQTHPGSLPIRQVYIAMLQQAGQIKEAAAELQRLADKSPTDPALWPQLATLYQTLGDQAKLELALDKTIALLPKDANTAIQTAQLYEQFQQPEKARKTLETAAKSQGPQSDPADALANFLARHQQLDQAIALWTTAAKTADRENLLRISRALAANGKTAEAHAVLADRIKDFAADPLLFSALCQAALLTDQAAATIPHALALLDLAQTPTDTQAAVTLTTTLIHRAQLEQQTIDQLTAAPNPSTPRLCLLAQLHESLGDSLSSQKTLKQAAVNDSNHTALYQQITLHETRGDLPAAIRTLEELIALPGNRKPLLLKQLVALQRRSGNLAEAATTAADWKTLAPGDKFASLTLAELHTELGDPQKATAELRRAAAKFGNDTELREKLVQSLLDSGSHTDALRLQLQLLDEADSTAAKLKCVPRVAETARILGRELEIEELFRKRARENPTATGPLLILREFLNTLQRQPEANDLLAQAARLAPTDLDLQNQLADQLEATNQIDQAEALLLSIHQQRPTPESLRKLSSFYLRTGDDDKAAALTQQAALQSTDPRELEAFVIAILQTGKWQTGIDILTSAKAEVTSDWRLTYLRGVALEQLGQTAAALKIFVPLLQTQIELTNLPKPLFPANSLYGYNPYGRPSGKAQLTPEQQALNDFNQAIQMAYPLDPNSGYGSYYGRSGFRNSGSPAAYQLILPTDARTLRLYSLIHGLKIAVGTPVDQRSPILAQLVLPELISLPGLLKIAALGESDKLDTLLAANPGDSALALACLNGDYLAHLFAAVSPAKSGRNSRQYPRRQNTYTIKPATWDLVTEKLQTTHPAVSLAASFRSSALASVSSPEALKKSIEICLVSYRALPANERKSYTYSLLERAYSLKRNPVTAAAADELLAALTQDLDPDDPYLLPLANITLCPKLQAAALAGDYTTAVTLTNQFVAGIRASIKTNAAIYGNQSYNRYGRSGYGGSGSEIPALLPHWQLANSFNEYNSLLQNATYQGCSFLTPFQPRESGNRPTPAVTPALTALLKELETTATPAQNPAPAPPAPPAFTITDKPAFLAALEKLSDPLLKLIILDALKFEPEVRAAIVKLTGPAAQPTVPVLLWTSAYYAARPDDLLPAYQLAVRAQAARPDPAAAPLADSQLLAIAFKLDEKSRAAVDLDPARSLALRRAKSITEESYRKTFAQHLETLGLKDAADRLKTPVSPAVLARRASYRSSSYSTARSTTASAAALVRQGNRPAAARLLYRQMIATLRPNNGYGGSSTDAFHQVTQLKLAPDIAEAMRPPANASFTRRAEFVKILSRIAPPADSRADLEKLHAEKPDDIEILSLFCAVAEPARAAELFKTLAAQSDNDLSELGGQLMKRENDSPRTIEAIQARLNRWTAVIALLDAIPAAQSSRKNLTWVNQHALQLANGNSLGSFSIPQYGSVSIPAFGAPLEKLRDGASATDKERLEASEKIAKLRDDTVRAVATAMLKHPGTASQAFEILFAGRSTLGIDDAALYQLAIDALSATLPTDLVVDPNAEIHVSYTSQQRRWALLNQGSYDGSGDSIPNGILPETFLARHAAAHPDLDVTEALLAKLPEASATQLKAWFTFFAKPTASEAATRLQQIQSDPGQLRVFLAATALACLSRNDASSAFDLLFAAIKPSSLIQPANLQQAYDPFANPSPNNGRNLASIKAIVSRWLNTPDVSKRWSRLHQLATIILGPERHWPAYASINFQNSGDSAQPARSRLTILSSFFTSEGSGQHQRDYLPQRFLRSNRLPSTDNNSNDSLQIFFNQLDSGPQNEKVARCQKSIDQILATNLFLPGPGLISEDGSFIPLGLTRSISQNSEKATLKLVGEALLNVPGPNRFWATLTGFIITKRESSAFLPLLLQELPSIKKWPNTEQMAFATFLIATWPDLEKSKAAPWFATNTRNASKILATRLKESIQTCRDGQNYNSSNQISSQTLALLRCDPDSVATIWNDALTREVNDPRPQGNSSMGGSSGQAPFTPVQEIYRQIISNVSHSDGLPAPILLRCVLTLSRTPAHRALAVRNPDLNSRLQSLLSKIIQDRNPLLSAKWQSLKDIPAACIIPIFEIFSDQDLTDFPRLIRDIGEFDSYLHSLNAKSLEALEPWLKQDLEPHKPLCAKLARFMLASNFANRGQSSEKAISSRLLVETANTLMADPAINASSRLDILSRTSSCQAAVLSNPEFIAHVLAWAKDVTPPPVESLGSATTLINALAAFKSLPPETAAQLASHTIPAILKTASTNSSNSSYQAQILPSWLALAHQSLDKNAVETVVAANLPSFAGRYDHITRLTLDGYPEIAATLVPKPQEISLLDSCYLYSGGSNGSVKFYFTKSLEATLPALLTAIPDPQQRYRVECLMNLYPESTDAAEIPLVPRNERIAKLVARFPTDAPPHPQAKLEILCAIASGPNTELANDLRTLCGNLSMGDIIEQQHPSGGSSPNPADLQRLDFQMAALDRLISTNLNAGNPATFFRQVQSLTQVDEHSRGYTSYRLVPLFQNFAPRSLSSILHAPADKRPGILKQATDLISGIFAVSTDSHDSSYLARWRLYLILAHAAAGQGAALESWWQTQPDTFKKTIQLSPKDANNSNSYMRQYAYQYWKNMPFEIKGHPQAAAEILTALLADPALSKIEIVNRSVLTEMVSCGMFSAETVHAAIDAVPDTVARKPEYLTEKATMLASRLNQPDAADKTFLHAKELAKQRNYTDYLDMLNASHAIMLINANRDAEALTIAALVNTANLDEATRKLFNTRLNQLEKRSSPPPKHEDSAR